jgi:hypothetical protein
VPSTLAKLNFKCAELDRQLNAAIPIMDRALFYDNEILQAVTLSSAARSADVSPALTRTSRVTACASLVFTPRGLKFGAR